MKRHTLGQIFIYSFLLLHCNLVIPESHAQAHPDPIMLPFSSGEQWYICQGYNTPAITHNDNWNAKFAIDFSKDRCARTVASARASTGRKVLAPGSGRLVRTTTPDVACIELDRGVTVFIGHLDKASRRSNGRVQAGDRIGIVAAPDLNINGGYAHIHIQAHSGAQCGKPILRRMFIDAGPTIPFAEAYGMRFVNAPDLPDTGGVDQHRGEILARAPAPPPLAPVR